MEEIIYNTASASLSFDRAKKRIELLWKKAANSEEYRELFFNLVEFARKNKVQFFMSDLRNEGHVPVEDLQWLDAKVLKIAGELGIVKVALINEDSMFSTIYAETIKRKLENSPVEVMLFDSPESARSWFEPV